MRTLEEWRALSEEEYFREYQKFVYDPQNMYKCKGCPHNVSIKAERPCGHHKCWVGIHCNRE